MRLATLAVSALLSSASAAPSLVIVGDSIAEGHPRTHGRLHKGASGGVDLTLPNVAGQTAYVLERTLRIPVINQGIGSTTCAQTRSRWARDVLATTSDRTIPNPPTLVVLHCGINDVFAGRSAEDVSADLTWLIESARNRGIRVVVDTIGGHGEFTQKDPRWTTVQTINMWLTQAYGAMPGVVVADYAGFFADSASPWLPKRALMADSVHPNADGYAAWGASLAALIANKLMR